VQTAQTEQSNKHRKTKIICTIGPATSSFEMLQAMAEAGMNIVRLNMSHGDHESHRKVIRAIKTINQKTEYAVPVLLDTQGPEIRTGDLEGELELKNGDEITVSVRSGNVEERSISIEYEDLLETVEEGDRITVDNGLINLEVLEKEKRQMRCRVIDGGMLGSKRHVNFPGVKVNLPAITKKDREDILFGVEQGVDFIALSFVREASDVHALKELLGEKAGKIKIIAKIEDQEGLNNLDEIIQAADGIMVARGDLGVEIDFQELPNEQRKIVKRCHQFGKRVIVATHMLESMIENPMPTRAEVTDVANAVYEEADAIMLSGETAVGSYPLKCIENLDKIARQSEQWPGLNYAQFLEKDCDKQSLAVSAVELAENLKSSGILVVTRRGVMVQYVCNARPFSSAIYAFTNDSRTRRQLAINRSVQAFRMEFSSDPEKTLAQALTVLKEKEGLQPGEKVVVISDVIAGKGVDAIQIRVIE
jgi:pyruvate kinase